MRRKQECLPVLVICLALTLAACGETGAESPTTANASTAGNAQTGGQNGVETISNGGGFTAAYEYAPEDTDAAWQGEEITTVVFDGGGAQITGPGAAFSGGTLTVSAAGTYVLSGTLADGQVCVDAGKKDIVRLVLNGVSMHNETGPAIYAPAAKKVVLILADGSENRVSDGADYVLAGDDPPDAAIFVKNSLSVTGNGSLAVAANYKHGIRAQDVLAVSGGNLTVKSAADALRGRDGVAIQGGRLTLEAGGDGIQSNNDQDDAKGFVVVSGGELDIRAGSDGVQAQSALTIAGGAFSIVTGGGASAAPARAEEFPGMGGGWGNPWGGESDSAGTAENESVSKKALKAGKRLTVAGGTFDIDAEDDAVHCNGDVIITAGTFSIQTGDDGFHADNALSVSGGNIQISVCYEGLEGMSITVSGGDIFITASDDGINAAAGSGEETGLGGPMGWGGAAASGDIFIRLSGGSLDVYGGRDGVDSNGNVFIEGGAVKISSLSQGMEGAIDLDGTLTVSGGELITAGSVASVSQSSTQPVILISYGGQVASGGVIEIRDEDGNSLLAYQSRISCTLSGFTSPAFRLGETYSLWINGEKRTDIKLDATITSLSDSGGAYSGGMGGMGGGRPGGRR